MRARKGFTLVELLVVIGIIAILIAVLPRRGHGAYGNYSLEDGHVDTLTLEATLAAPLSGGLAQAPIAGLRTRNPAH